jgi:proline racemase
MRLPSSPFSNARSMIALHTHLREAPMKNWQPPADWQQITSIDTHTAGEPLRIITSGFPELPGNTILEKRQYARQHYDHLRRTLMWEPRGHADMYGCILTPPVTPDGDVGVLFMHNEGFSTMCGHGIIGLVKVGVETGYFPAQGAKTMVKIDTPAGRVTATAHRRADGRVERVSFLNVPSFLLERDLQVQVAGLGTVTCDIAFGGAFYAYVDADSVHVNITPENQQALIDVGMRIKRAVMDSYPIVHPAGDADLNFLYGTILVKRLSGEIQSRNVCIFAEGEVDRSPTGTGVSGRLAIHHARGELALNQTITIESLISTPFTGRVVETTRVGALPAIIPEVSGTASITGKHTLQFDPDDPLAAGLLLR